MGDLFSGSTKTTSEDKVDLGASKFQQPYLNTAFDAAKSNYTSSAGTPYYQGDTHAGLTDEQKASLDAMSGYASGAGMSGANGISAVGTNMINRSSGAALDNLDRFTTMAGQDPTKANIAAANQYADNPYVEGMIDANARDVNRNLYENDIPGIDRAASGSGNINSSRTGVAAGIAQRGAADRIADISASIRGDAYNRGLTMAQTDRANTMDAYGRAASAYGDMTNSGISALKTGSDMAYDAFGHQLDAEGQVQQDNQGELDANFAKWQGEDTRSTDLLKRYYDIVGANQWGQSGTTTGTNTQKTSGNILGQLAGAAAAGASLYTGLKSDRRLKHGIRKIGELADGLGIYTYFYRQDLSEENGFNLPHGLQVGVMADEVEQLRPHALGPTDRGYATVNYQAL